jgi:hypothetical protein
MPSLSPSIPFWRPRPAGPRCRGGASSLLRLAQPGSSAALAPWLMRAASSGGARGFAADDEGLPTSIITRLLPSHELARG